MKTIEFIKKEWLPLYLLSLPFFAIILYWNDFPAQIQMHWILSNETAQSTNKEIGLFFIPILNVIFYFMFLVLPRIDNRKQNYHFFDTSYKIIRLCVLSIFLFMFLLIFHSSLAHTLNISIIAIFISTFYFLISGNFLNNFRLNKFFFFKTPWIKKSEETRNKTHGLSTKLWLLLSLGMLTAFFFAPFDLLIIIYSSYIIAVYVLPIVYSFIIFKKDKVPKNDNIINENETDI